MTSILGSTVQIAPVEPYFANTGAFVTNLASSGPTPALLLIAIGESNAGGFAPNASATAGELASRSQVQMWNVSTDVFENLDIGTNNNLDHAGLDSTSHGIELELANAVAGNRFTQNRVYYVQCGQGASNVSEWGTGHGSGFWTEALARIQAAKAELDAANTSYTPVVFYSQGINDSLGNAFYGGTAFGVDTAGWKTATIAVLAKIRVELGAETLIVMTKFKSIYSTYNTVIDEIAAADAYTVAIETPDSGIEWNVDGNHWTYVGYKNLCNLFIDEVLAANGTAAAPTASPVAGEYGASQEITLSAGSGAQIRYLDSASAIFADPYTGGVYSAPFTVTMPRDVHARAIERGKKSSAIAQFVYTAPITLAFETGSVGTYIALSNGNLDAQGTASGWAAARATPSESSGKVYFEFMVVTTSTGGGAMGIGLLDDTTAGGAGMNAVAIANGNGIRDDGFGFGNFSVVTTANATGLGNLSNNDIIGLAVDFAGAKAWVAVNNTWIASGDPAAGTNNKWGITGSPTLFPAVWLFGTGEKARIQTTNTYSPPSGFSAWGG